MPYISQADRDIVDPHIQTLRTLIMLEACEHPKPLLRAFRIMHDVALTVVLSAADSAAMRVHNKSGLRYWIVNDIDGLFGSDMPREIARRLGIPEPSSLFRDQIFPGWWRELDTQEPPVLSAHLISGLQTAINAAATREKNAEVQSSYVGMCNYSFCELSINVFFDVLVESYSGAELQFLVWFWKRLGKYFYATLGGPYEDTAIAKNGDCKAFIRALEIMKRDQ